MRQRGMQGEQASIPLVLLAAIVLGGIIIALYLDVSTGLRLASADRDFNQAIQVADAGLQEAFTVLAALDEDDEAALPAIGEMLPAAAPGSPGRGTYTWTARRVGSNSWHVRSTGSFGVHERALESTMGPLQLFNLAAFGDILLELRGANAADSYPAGGQGNVGSNTAIVLRGNAEVDWVMRYGLATYNSGGVIRSGGGIETGETQELPDTGGLAYIDGGLCDGAVIYPNVSDIGQLQRGQSYCVSQARFEPGHHTVTGLATAGPARIYIAPSGNLELLGQGAGTPCTGPNGTACVNVDASDMTPDATALEIYLASGGGEVLANNHTRIAAGIYAPLSACSGPNAQGDVFGSIICRTLDSKGGWQFHYDERFDGVDVAAFAIQGIREELGDGTSFAVVD